MKHIKLFESYHKKKPQAKPKNTVTKKVKAYHASNSTSIKNFTIEKDNGLNLFGKAIYFSSSYNNISKFGNKLYEAELTLNNPLLLNKTMTVAGANSLLKRLENFTGETYDYTFSEEDYDGVQYGEFLIEMSNHTDLYYHIEGFIKSLGYDSFMHYADYETNYIEEQPSGKHDEKFVTYGVYYDNQVRITERHFRQDEEDNNNDEYDPYDYGDEDEEE